MSCCTNMYVLTTPKQEFRAVGADPAAQTQGRTCSPWRAHKLEGQRAGGEEETEGSEMVRSRPQSKPVINLGTRPTSSGPLLQQNKSAISHLPPVLSCYFPTITPLSFCKLQGILTGGCYFSGQKNLLLTPWVVVGRTEPTLGHKARNQSCYMHLRKHSSQNTLYQASIPWLNNLIFFSFVDLNFCCWCLILRNWKGFICWLGLICTRNQSWSLYIWVKSIGNWVLIKVQDELKIWSHKNSWAACTKTHIVSQISPGAKSIILTTCTFP